MAKSNGHALECGCPSCVTLDSQQSTDQLQSRMSDNPNDNTSSAYQVLTNRGEATR